MRYIKSIGEYMSKHTKGPWIVTSDNNSWNTNEYKCSIVSQEVVTDSSMGANERLIAAAPELLEKLIHCYGALTMGKLDDFNREALINEIDYVILKAEGKE